jgi:3-deoxy-D-manno-octulosonic acid kinase
VRQNNYIEHNTHILFNADLLAAAPVELFERRIIQRASPPGKLQRGTALYFDHAGIPMVLKHYHRGGWIGKLVRDTYSRYAFPLLLREPRMWEEFRLLSRMRELGLPVPEPIAARYQVTSPLTYRGDLITRRISNSRTLSDCLLESALSAKQWQAIGHTIAHFHAHQVFHADLNAHNILLDAAGHTWLVDFDKSGIHKPGTSSEWKQANLQRLLRSLRKIGRKVPFLPFADSDWQHLLQGYSSSRSRELFDLKPEQQYF